MSRRILIAGNWKMNSAPEGACTESSVYHSTEHVDVAVFPTFLDLEECIAAGILTGGQFGHPEAHGAHTGDISMAMLKDNGCSMVLCGHSERRDHHKETNAHVAQQAKAALEVGLHPIVCIGETEAEREHNEQEDVIRRQMADLPLNADITIAYEPVWAIGTGNTATPEQAQEIHALIRSLLPEERTESTRILYGGSMKPSNAQELLLQPDIDGGLIGGASLEPEAFGEIIAIAEQLSQDN
ncbi:MAG: triose-phosphate isomerase [bacterium]|nr:triose-phosphate isomerase [bacterium]